MLQLEKKTIRSWTLRSRFPAVSKCVSSAQRTPGRSSNSTEVYAVVRIDGTTKASTKPKTQRWDEAFEFNLEKAVECEVAVYSRPSNVLLALSWFKLTDLVEDLKTKHGNNVPANLNDADEIWLDMEPAGQLLFRVTFASGTGKPVETPGLFRREAVQKAYPRNGHKFFAYNGFQMVQCAVCNELLSGGQAYRCQSCLYTIHAKCYTDVITKCITMTEIKNCSPMVPYFCGLGPNDAKILVEAFKKHEEDMHRRELEEAERARKEMEENPPAPTFTSGYVQQLSDNLVHSPATTMLSSGASYPPWHQQQLQQQQPPHLSPKPPKPSKTQTRRGDPHQMNIPVAVHKNITLNDFHFVAVLGRGAFGKVMLAQEKATTKHYAIKALKKEFIIKNDDVKSAKLERRIFQAASAAQHPFMVNLHSCFQTPERVYFVMEYVSGETVLTNRAKFYACEVLLAIEYFHKNNIIYRDLKLDNILMCPDGHLKVADYGICKENMPYGATTRTYCGTPDYMAPEILSENKYGRAVDWWSYGVLIYVMLVGRRDILDLILSDAIEYPSNMPRDTLSLLHGPARRLGGGKLDAEEVKRHPYFAGVDWNAFMQKKVPPPWKPTINGATDVSNFDAEFTKEPAVLTPISTVLPAANQKEFDDFDYVADWAGR
ncbi:kinase-like domain-containing protein [Chytridium lagenaria]|nr:kinase-like domain-containing protein [Chytridium lagenaria]